MRIVSIWLICLSLVVSWSRAPLAADAQEDASASSTDELVAQVIAWHAPAGLNLRILPPVPDTEIHCKWTIDGSTVSCDLLLAVPFEHEVWDRARRVADDFEIPTDKLGIKGSPGMYYFSFPDFEESADAARLVGILLREVFLLGDNELVRYYFQQ